MSPDAPHGRVPALGQVLVSQVLGVEVVDFETRVVHVRWGRGRDGRHEECVVVYGSGAQVYVQERRDFFSRGGVGDRDVEDVGGDEVEGLGVVV